MLSPVLLAVFVFGLSVHAHGSGLVANDDQNMSGLKLNGIPFETRVRFMREVRPSLGWIQGLPLLRR